MFHHNDGNILGKRHIRKTYACEVLFFKKFEDKIHITKGIIGMAWQDV
jgi:hypothetical protein